MKKTKDLTPEKWDAKSLPERLLMDLRTDCNLACPMCLLHGSGVPDSPEKELAIGKMGLDKARSVLDEVMSVKPLIQPSMWGEPLLAKDLKEHLTQMKSRGISVALNTNGLTLKEDLAEFFVKEKIDTVFFSLDSTTPETLMKVRGVNKLQKIEQNLLMLLRIRDEMKSIYPRIGATMTIQDENVHELNEFIEKWVPIVDVVRVGAVFKHGHLIGIKPPSNRLPCAMLYHTMPIHYNGDVSICCWDSHGREIMGNVFKDGGVEAVWQGKKFKEIRSKHENGEFDQIPYCKDCNAWSGHLYEEETSTISGEEVLIRRSAQFAYYNRVNRLDSWHENMRGHQPR